MGTQSGHSGHLTRPDLFRDRPGGKIGTGGEEDTGGTGTGTGTDTDAGTGFEISIYGYEERERERELEVLYISTGTQTWNLEEVKDPPNAELGKSRCESHAWLVKMRDAMRSPSPSPSPSRRSHAMGCDGNGKEMPCST